MVLKPLNQYRIVNSCKMAVNVHLIGDFTISFVCTQVKSVRLTRNCTHNFQLSGNFYFFSHCHKFNKDAMNRLIIVTCNTLSLNHKCHCCIKFNCVSVVL